MSFNTDALRRPRARRRSTLLALIRETRRAKHRLRIRSIISFHGETVKQLRSAFKLAVDDYLAACEEPFVAFDGGGHAP
jgi:hypothetical protein